MPEIFIRPSFQLEGKLFRDYAEALTFLQHRNDGKRWFEEWKEVKVSIMLSPGESKTPMEEFIHYLNLQQIDYEVFW